MAINPDVDVVARTIVGEARGQSLLDMLAVGAVIRERFLRPGWWGHTWEEVCKKPWQFTCWQDRNLEVMKHAEITVPKIWPIALVVADLVVNHMRDRDVAELFGTNGPHVTHYHDRSMPRPQSWGECEVVPTPWNSAFLFYRNVAGTPERQNKEVT